jgi:hypothetical protein
MKEKGVSVGTSNQPLPEIDEVLFDVSCLLQSEKIALTIA